MMSGVDVILDILKAVLKEKPDSVFVNSLHQQYCNRGGLSKKQLEGLLGKAEKIDTIPVGKLATLQAIIKKKATRYKSEMPVVAPEKPKDDSLGKNMEAILSKYPEHKRILFLHSKFINNQPITAAEALEVERL